MAAVPDLDAAMVAIRERPTVDVPIACAALAISTWSGYQSIKRGDFPVPTLTIGRRIVVPTAPLRRALGLQESA